MEATKADTKALCKEIRAELERLKASNKAALREFELRMRLHHYTVAIVIIGVLAALELIPR